MEGISSNPIFVYLFKDYDNLKIIQNSLSNHSYQTFQSLYPSFQIKATFNGNPVSNLPIIASLSKGKENAYIENKESEQFNAILNHANLNFTNEEGIASFELLTLIGLDSQNCTMISLKFKVASSN